MTRLIISSRTVTSRVRRKTLNGCYVIGEWTVVPDERRIEKSGRVVAVCRELMDALLCLIEAQGEFVSLEQLKSKMWPNTAVSDERTGGYVTDLQQALEKDSGPATVIERHPDFGHRLLVNARVAGPDDAPKPELEKRKVPADPHRVDDVVARYILTYHPNLMTKLEGQVYGHLHARSKMTGLDNRSPQHSYKSDGYFRYLSTDPIVLKLATDGYEAFAARTATRILEEYGDQLKLNRCPNCACIARTQTAHQCRVCGCDWHPR